MSVGFRVEDGVPFIKDRAYPWASKVRFDNIDPPTPAWRSRGFWLTFENGWTLSIQFGQGNYCANYDYGLRSQEWFEDCPTAEIAAWPPGGDMVHWDVSGDSVLGHQNADQVLAHIEDVSTRPSFVAAGAPDSATTDRGQK